MKRVKPAEFHRFLSKSNQTNNQEEMEISTTLLYAASGFPHFLWNIPLEAKLIKAGCQPMISPGRCKLEKGRMDVGDAMLILRR